MFESLPKILREALEGGLLDEDLQQVKNNPDFLLKLRQLLEEKLTVLKCLCEDESVSWVDKVDALSWVLGTVLNGKRIGSEEHDNAVAMCLTLLMAQLPLKKKKKTLKKCWLMSRQYKKFGNKLAKQASLGTELIKDALGESDDAVFDEMEKNLDELEAMTDEEIEEVIEEAFVMMKDGLPQEEKQIDAIHKMEKGIEGWDAIEAGYNFCFTIDKEDLLGFFVACPDLMAKKIEEAKTIYANLPPVYLKFAERWKEEKTS